MLESTARLLRLLSLLQTGQEWSGAELADQSGCSPRTVRRDIDRLRELGYPIHASRGTAGYRLEAGTRLPPLLFDDDEAVAIVLGLRTAAARYVTDMEEVAERALGKLERLLPTRLGHRVTALEAVTVPTSSVGPTVDSDLITLVAGACSEHLRLHFDYTDHEGSTSTRRVEPHRLVHTGRRWYLVAYDLDRADWRSFRADRMQRSRQLGTPFTPRQIPGGDAVAFVTRGIASRLWQHQVRVRLHVPAASVAERLPPSTAALVAVDAQTCLLDLGGDRLDRLAADLCALSADFDIVDGPEGLGEQLDAIARHLQRHVRS